MEIVNYKVISKGCLVSKFDVVIPEWGLTIKECTLFQKDNRRWVGLPSRQYEKEGKQKSYDLIAFEKERRARFEQAVIGKIDSGQYQQKTDNNARAVSGLPF